MDAIPEVDIVNSAQQAASRTAGFYQPLSLYLGFAILLLSFIGISYFSYQRFYETNNRLVQEITNNDVQALAAMKMRVAVRERAILLWQMSIQSDPFVRDELFMKFRDFGSKYQLYRDQYLATRMTETEKQVLDNLDAETGKRAPMLRTFSEDLMTDDGLEVYTPQLNQVLSNQILVANILDELINMQRSENQYANEINLQETSSLVNQLIVMLSILLVSGIGFSWHVVHTISRQRQQLFDANRELHHVARKDALTGLQNRMALMEHLHHNQALARRHGLTGALLYIDLDGFKSINDRYGHEVGDKYLQEISRQMSMLRESDLIARLGGDEFVVIIMNIEHEDDVLVVANKLLEKLSASYVIAGNEVSSSASIGICFFPEMDMTADELLGCADNAMYTAKKGGKNRYQIGRPDHSLNFHRNSKS
jgi:diguanylate cyclase (GGDEF)-like protein